MSDDHDPSDDSELPPGLDSALDRGLERAFGENDRKDGPIDSPSVIQRIVEITGSMPTVSLRDADAVGHTPILKPLTSSDGIAHRTGKYMVQGLLGQGGVGTVHKGHDQDLGRDVAMKFLHEKYKDEPAILHRFVEEAQIGGQLQHPGIVPVYELGMSDGRPFFAMKMVKGQTLAKKLADRSSPAADRRTFLSIFEDICQTMAYAHARGVVHRDLKPANIMIGSFGEVQVVDWGMGKVLERGGVADEKRAAEQQADPSIVETVRSSGHGTQSIMGSVMGTPAYMPPEQALGDVERMDERSDVFSLGAILCEILTGLPPYVGKRDDLLGMAAMSKLDDAHQRLAGCGADDELVALAKQCLLAAPAARPKSAEAVASAIHAHLGAAERRAHEANARSIALKRTQKLGIALTVVIAAGLAASLWFWQAAVASAASAKQAAQNEKEARELADARAQEAAAARDAAQANLDNFDRLSHVVRLEAAKAGEQGFYPTWPANSDKMRSWLENEARDLTNALPELRATLARLEQRAEPQSSDVEAEASTSMQFQNGADGFLHSTLRRLVADIEAFDRREVATVRQRLTWSEHVEDLTITRNAARWNEARLAILKSDGVTASELYGAVPTELTPQMGLVPIGMNPVTLLWEFYHLRSAWDGTSEPASIAIPAHREDGSIDVEEHTGIVFVLLPGATLAVGSQKSDPTGPNYDSRAQADEPLHIVEVAPFLLARHELTQGQWTRLWTGDEARRHPCHYGPGFVAPGLQAPVDGTHPVEQVDWLMCVETMARHGLMLPSEAQWEHGCRATTTTPYWCDPTELEKFANLADATAKRAGVTWTCEGWSDGHIIHAPVGSFGANPFGLFDVHGNVSEWCQNAHTSSANRTHRGGSYLNPASFARSAFRGFDPPTFLNATVGLRAARAVRLGE